MYEFRLNGIEIDEPMNFDHCVFKWERSKKYFGSIFKERLFTLGSKEITYEDRRVYDLIVGAFEADGLFAEVRFEVWFCDEQAFEGWLDMATLKWDEKRVSCSFVDKPLVQEWVANVGTKYDITPNVQIDLHGQNLVGTITHTIDDNLRTVADNSVSVGIEHTIPLKLKNSVSVVGIAQSVSNVRQRQPIYTNNTSQSVTIDLEGVIDVEVRGNSFGFQVIIECAGNPQFISMGTGTVTTFLNNILVKATVTVAPSRSIYLYVRETLPFVGFYAFFYKSTSYLSVEERDDIVGSVAFGAEAGYLLDRIIKKSNGMKSVFSEIEGNSNLIFTNGLNIRGKNGEISTSFDEVFEFLNTRYNLAVDVTDLGVWVGSKQELMDGYGTYNLGTPDDVQFSPNMDWYFSDSKVGYKTWQAESRMGNGEFNSGREYSFRSPVKNTLNLETDVIASGYVIEETRRKQFDVKKVNDWKYDHNLFVIDAVPVGTSYRSRVAAEITHNEIFYLPNKENISTYNFDLAPEFSMLKWARFFGLSGNAKFVSGTGNTNVFGRNIAKGFPVFGKRAIKLTQSMEAYEFKKVGYGFVSFDYCGEKIKGLIVSKQLNFNPNHESKAEFFLWEIN